MTVLSNTRQLDNEQILIALRKVEQINNVQLEHLNKFMQESPQAAGKAFEQLVALDSVDDKIKFVLREYPQLQQDAHHMLEASILLA